MRSIDVERIDQERRRCSVRALANLRPSLGIIVGRRYDLRVSRRVHDRVVS